MLSALCDCLASSGANVESKGVSVRVRGVPAWSPADITTAPYPGFPTDLQPPMVTYLSLAGGASNVEETIFDSRFVYVSELIRMGAEITVSGRTARVTGVAKLKDAVVAAPDIRAGGALVLAALAAEGTTEIGGLDFSLSTLTAHLYNITMRGTEGPGQPPLLHADELTVRIKIVSALHRQVALRELRIEHPVIHFQVGKDGKNNLPATPPSQRSGDTSVFDLAVQHAQLKSGELNYNDQTIPLEADLYNLGSNIRFDSLLKRYEGTVSYASGDIHYAQYSPLAHSLNLAFDA